LCHWSFEKVVGVLESVPESPGEGHLVGFTSKAILGLILN
jgi:hypothetical protein